MDEEKICPINPHGNGYCKCDKCAWWIEAIDDDFNCAFVVLTKAIDNIDAHGIDTYERNA